MVMIVTVSCLSNCGPGRSGHVISRVRRRADTRRWRVVSRRAELLTSSRRADVLRCLFCFMCGQLAIAND